jgi:hypothetical protein
MPHKPDLDDTGHLLDQARAEAAALHERADVVQLAAVREARRRGWLWGQIGARNGTSGEAARKRWAARIDPETNTPEVTP